MKKLKSKAEDALFKVIELLPEKWIPQSVMELTAKYLDSRLGELNRDQVKANWQKVDLEQKLDKIKES